MGWKIIHLPTLLEVQLAEQLLVFDTKWEVDKFLRETTFGQDRKTGHLVLWPDRHPSWMRANFLNLEQCEFEPVEVRNHV